MPKMEVKPEQKIEQEKLRRLEYQEDIDRVTAVGHLQVEHFSKHAKIEGYYENALGRGQFGCDRLFKLESMFGRMQLGYNAVRRRSFLFAEIKTSRYDTVSERYQRAMKEYQINSRQDAPRQTRVFAVKRRTEPVVLLENIQTKPWSERVIRSNFSRVNMDVLSKVMPFMDREGNRRRLQELRIEARRLQEEVQQNINEGKFENNVALRQQQVRHLMEENFLGHLLRCKEASSRYVIRRMNMAFDMQKNEMFEYYKNKRQEEHDTTETSAASAEEDNSEEL